ncbi:MAG TPA: DsbA family protein [Acidimicrobiales bacterium]|nr:DsbA family protein [Acidimicrobiales bacterium]
MTTRTFSLTWDYRCPYARNAHEHVVAALQAGADWEVQFVPFALEQAHVAEGDPAVWDGPDRYPGLLATEAGIVVRDQFPERFLTAHVALFGARLDRALDTRKPEVVAEVLDQHGVDGAAVLEAIDDGWPLEAFRKEHEAAVADHQVFGVPTFVVGGHAAFVRLLTRPLGDALLATSTIERVLDLAGGWSDLNELKHTSIPR